MIYFIRSESGHVKIGYTKNNVLERMATLQPGCPFKLSLLKIIEGNTQQESLIHKKFKKDNRHNEWFNLSEELNKFIENPVEIIPPIKKQRIVDYSKLDELQKLVYSLIKQFGTIKITANQLGVNPRYLYMLQHKQRKASPHLIKLMKVLLEK